MRKTKDIYLSLTLLLPFLLTIARVCRLSVADLMLSLTDEGEWEQVSVHNAFEIEYSAEKTICKRIIRIYNLNPLKEGGRCVSLIIKLYITLAVRIRIGRMSGIVDNTYRSRNSAKFLSHSLRARRTQL
jgi:hypothetical protein